jgi:hypothetical protein
MCCDVGQHSWNRAIWRSSHMNNSAHENECNCTVPLELVPQAHFGVQQAGMLLMPALLGCGGALMAALHSTGSLSGVIIGAMTQLERVKQLKVCLHCVSHQPEPLQLHLCEVWDLLKGVH